MGVLWLSLQTSFNKPDMEATTFNDIDEVLVSIWFF